MQCTEKQVLSISLFLGTKEDALQRMQGFLKSTTVHTIATPNPEMAVEAWRFPSFARLLQGFSLRICDGVGLVLASCGKLHRYPGIDCMLDLLDFCEKEQKSVFFLGALSNETHKLFLVNILHFFPKLQISGFATGPEYTLKKTKDTYMILDHPDHIRIMSQLKDSSPNMLFVAFGHGKQEAWIAQYAKDIPGLSCAMGVGGAFDLIAGTYRRAPRFMRQIGLEWLWRLIREPRRFIRICTAVLVFPLLVCYEFCARLFDKKFIC